MNPELALVKSPERALEPYETILPEAEAVNNDLLEDILVGRCVIGPTTTFDTTLDLSRYTQAFKYLHDLEAQGNMLSESRIENQLEEQRQILIAIHGGISPADEEIIQKTREELEVQAELERSCVIYRNPRDNYIHHTEAEIGDFNSTPVNLHDVFIANNDPMLSLHTHPYNTLPSPFDHTYMLSKRPGSNRRIIASHVVLCPELQILVLPGNKTPLLSMDDVDKSLNQYKERFVNTTSARATVLARRIYNIKRHYVSHEQANFYEICMEIDSINNDPDIPEEEKKALVEALSQRHGTLDPKRERFKRAITRSYKKLDDYGNMTNNTAAIDWIREYDLQIYFSENGKDFEKTNF